VKKLCASDFCGSRENMEGNGDTGTQPSGGYAMNP